MIFRPWVVACDSCSATAELSMLSAADARRMAEGIHGWTRDRVTRDGRRRRGDVCPECQDDELAGTP